MAARMISVVFLVSVAPRGIAGAYFGKFIGAVTTYDHGVSGTAHAASDTTVVITGFNYDGKGPAAHFWVSQGDKGLDNKGDQLPDENGGTEILKAYNNAQVHLTLPKKISEYRSLGIYCKKFNADFGHVKIPADFELPKELSLGQLKDNQKGTTATEVMLKDSGTIVLKGFTHDAQCPSAKFVAAPNPQPKVDELMYLTYGDQKKDKLEKMDHAEVMVELPKGHHWNEFQWFSVYCVDKKESNADMAIHKTQAESLPLRFTEAPTNAPSPNSTPAPNTSVVIRSVPALTALCLAAVAAAFAVRRRPGSVLRIKCN